MRIIQQINIDGRNWADLFKLPCVRSLEKGEYEFLGAANGQDPEVCLFDRSLPEEYRLKNLPVLSPENLKEVLGAFLEKRSLAMHGEIGDKLVQYADGTWQVIHPNHPDTP